MNSVPKGDLIIIKPNKRFNTGYLSNIRIKFCPQLGTNHENTLKFHPNIILFDGNTILTSILTSVNIFHQRAITFSYPNTFIKNNRLMKLSNNWNISNKKDKDFLELEKLFNLSAVENSSFTNIISKGFAGPISIYNNNMLEYAINYIPAFSQFYNSFHKISFSHLYFPERVRFLFNKLIDISPHKRELKEELLFILNNYFHYKLSSEAKYEIQILLEILKNYPAEQLDMLSFKFSDSSFLLPEYKTLGISDELPLLTTNNGLITDVVCLDNNKEFKILMSSNTFFKNINNYKELSVDYIRGNQIIPARFVFNSNQHSDLADSKMLFGELKYLPFNNIGRFKDSAIFINENKLYPPLTSSVKPLAIMSNTFKD